MSIDPMEKLSGVCVAIVAVITTLHQNPRRRNRITILEVNWMHLEGSIESTAPLESDNPSRWPLVWPMDI